MIAFEEYFLDNGLHVILHPDDTTRLAAVNVMYDVGSRDEDENKTGLAHLLEHLMFSGSVNIPEYDRGLQRVGGENNAFTSSDLTNYYLTLPGKNIETALWLESDRMLDLNISQRAFEIQQRVVIEEFKQVYLNQPYGDVWQLIRTLAYKRHPYKWATIGKNIDQLKQMTLGDVQYFYNKFYNPNNAILSIAGNFDTGQVKGLISKWFGGIMPGEINRRVLPIEKKQIAERKLLTERKVPFSAIYKVFHMVKRNDPEYFVFDMISDLLSNGKSARFYEELVRKRKIFREIEAYVTGEIDPGLFIISGKPNEKVKMEVANKAIMEAIDEFKTDEISEEELKKVKNKFESSFLMSLISLQNRALHLAYFGLLGNTNLINTQVESYNNVQEYQIKDVMKKYFKDQNMSSLFYIPENQK